MLSRTNLSVAARYIVGGGAALATHLCTMVLLIQLGEVDATVASAIGFFTAIPVNFAFQRYLVFGSRAGIVVQFARYSFFTCLLALVNVILFATLYKFTQPYYILTQIVVTGTIVVLNFLISQNITFAPESDR